MLLDVDLLIRYDITHYERSLNLSNRTPAVESGNHSSVFITQLDIQTRRLDAFTLTAMSSTPTECSICLDRPTNPAMTPCTHVFCRRCIGTWLDRHSACPVCRHRITRGRRALVSVNSPRRAASAPAHPTTPVRGTATATAAAARTNTTSAAARTSATSTARTTGTTSARPPVARVTVSRRSTTTTTSSTGRSTTTTAGAVMRHAGILVPGRGSQTTSQRSCGRCTSRVLGAGTE